MRNSESGLRLVRAAANARQKLEERAAEKGLHFGRTPLRTTTPTPQSPHHEEASTSPFLPFSDAQRLFSSQQLAPFGTPSHLPYRLPCPSVPHIRGFFTSTEFNNDLQGIWQETHEQQRAIAEGLLTGIIPSPNHQKNSEAFATLSDQLNIVDSFQHNYKKIDLFYTVTQEMGKILEQFHQELVEHNPTPDDLKTFNNFTNKALELYQCFNTFHHIMFHNFNNQESFFNKLLKTRDPQEKSKVNKLKQEVDNFCENQKQELCTILNKLNLLYNATPEAQEYCHQQLQMACAGIHQNLFAYSLATISPQSVFPDSQYLPTTSETPPALTPAEHEKKLAEEFGKLKLMKRVTGNK